MGVYTYVCGNLEWRDSRLPSISYSSMSCWREPLSSLRVPSTTMASPYSETFSLMKRSALRILRRSVHHRNILEGAGYPIPSRQTQNVSSVFGLTRLVCIGMLFCLGRGLHHLQRIGDLLDDLGGLDQRV